MTALFATSPSPSWGWGQNKAGHSNLKWWLQFGLDAPFTMKHGTLGEGTHKVHVCVSLNSLVLNISIGVCLFLCIWTPWGRKQLLMGSNVLTTTLTIDSGAYPCFWAARDTQSVLREEPRGLVWLFCSSLCSAHAHLRKGPCGCLTEHRQGHHPNISLALALLEKQWSCFRHTKHQSGRPDSKPGPAPRGRSGTLVTATLHIDQKASRTGERWFLAREKICAFALGLWGRMIS